MTTRLPLAAGLAAAAALAVPPALAEDVDISILLVSDIYRMETDNGRGGFAKAAAVARAERGANEHMLYVHAGDTLSPSLMSSVDMGAHVVALLNVVPPDVFVPGNHEFDFGPERFEELVIGGLDAKILGANIRDGQGRRRYGIDDAHLYDFGGVKVGVYGLLSPAASELSSPGPNYSFLPMAEAAADAAAALREAGADILVAVAHASFAEDAMLMAVAGDHMDVLLSGDDHQLKIEFDGDVAFAETRSDADYMVAVDLKVSVSEKDGERRVRWWPNFRVIDSASYPPDPATDALAQGYLAQLDKEMDREIGVSSTPLDTRRATVRGTEAAFGNLLADAMRAFADADVGLANGGGIRANREYPAGARLSRRDVFKELPFGNDLVKLRLSGADLLAALENGVSKVEDGAGRFPQVAGLSMDVDLSKPAGARVSNVFIGDEKLQESGSYTVATNNYMAGGGDGYDSLVNGEVLLDGDDTDLVASILIEYIRANSPVAPQVEQRINYI
ncbi:MAG: 5'-nucleotidase C-terminal domain-containing protein [Betaproteobacteria bacterium AqS2]|uniref:5'-nucleotidase C-terminal domain-containing protein n=1 Tax=Candidatus Amphirhobacter heronislandensis TaxID=1732024 RepID=A0A930UIR2_9GAMM|nr:5'-nucleotidase C-terminal domain-containing protein [Betaproteobacteria bacterium AqS2]